MLLSDKARLVVKVDFPTPPLPDAIAIIFLTAPAMETPCGSLLGYNLRFELWNNSQIEFACSISLFATTAAAG